MKRLVGGDILTVDTAFKIVRYLNKLPSSKCMFYRYAFDKDNELFVVYGNYENVYAISFENVASAIETKSTVSNGLKTINLGRAEIEIDESNKNIYLSYIETEEKYRNLNVASEMLKFIESMAVKTGNKKITLECLNTYTDGWTEVKDLDRKEDREAIEKMKQSGNMVNKTLNFYLKNNYKIDNNHKKKYGYLTPMIKSELKYVKPKINEIQKCFSFGYKIFSFNRINRLKRSVLKNKDDKMKVMTRGIFDIDHRQL